jgi:hypothetical protein
MKLFADPVVRLALRALLAGGVAFSTKFFVFTNGHVNTQSAALASACVAGGLALAETFTPLNNLVGLFKEIDVMVAKSAPVSAPTKVAKVPAKTAAKP